MYIYIYIHLRHVFETPVTIDFAGYAGDNTPYTYSSNIENNLLDNLQEALEKVFHCFSTNHFLTKSNSGKLHLLTSCKTP